MNMLL